MDDIFLDNSWSLYFNIGTVASGYRKLFSASLSEDRISSYSETLTNSFKSWHASRMRDDFDDEDEKLGQLKECHWSTVSRPRAAALSTENRGTAQTGSISSRKSHSISIVYQKQTYRFILYSGRLLLAKSSNACLTRFTTFLRDAFDIVDVKPLKLEPGFLQQMLRDYITTLCSTTTTDRDMDVDMDKDDEDGADERNQTAQRLAILKTAITNLKLTISFSGPVAPNLKTIDLDIPHETINTLLAKQLANDNNTSMPPTTSGTETTTTSSSLGPETNPTRTKRTNPPESERGEPSKVEAGTKFLQNLSHYLTQRTGLKIPLTTSTIYVSPEDNDDDNTTNSNSNFHHDNNNNSDNNDNETTQERTMATTAATAAPIKLTRVTTAFWVLGVEGKVKFSRKVVDGNSTGTTSTGTAGGDAGFENLIRLAGADILAAIDQEAGSRVES